MTHAKNCPPREHLADAAFALRGKSPRSGQAEAALSHAQTCETCRKLLKEYGNTVELAHRALAPHAPKQPTTACLDENTLAAYVDDVLQPAERDLAEQHMARCRYCLERLAELSELVSQADAPGLFEYVLGIAEKGLRLLTHPQAGFTLLQPEPAPVLDGKPQAVEEHRKVQTWTQRTGDVTLTFSAVHVDASRISLTLRADRDGKPLARAQLAVRSGGRLIQSQPLSEEGAAILENLEPSQYDCGIAEPEVVFTVTLCADW